MIRSKVVDLNKINIFAILDFLFCVENWLKLDFLVLFMIFRGLFKNCIRKKYFSWFLDLLFVVDLNKINNLGFVKFDCVLKNGIKLDFLVLFMIFRGLFEKQSCRSQKKFFFYFCRIWILCLVINLIFFLYFLRLIFLNIFAIVLLILCRKLTLIWFFVAVIFMIFKGLFESWLEAKLYISIKQTFFKI